MHQYCTLAESGKADISTYFLHYAYLEISASILLLLFLCPLHDEIRVPRCNNIQRSFLCDHLLHKLIICLSGRVLMLEFYIAQKSSSFHKATAVVGSTG